MPYSYHESQKLSPQNALALKTLAATGELPKNHYWNTLRARHDANPTRFDRANAVLGALLDRDQAQRLGTATANSPLFPNSKFIQYALNKHNLNSIRFDRWHPFLGRLFDLQLPAPDTGSTGGETITNPPPGTETPGGLNPLPGGGGGTGGGTIINQPPDSNSIPEPASALMMGIAVACTLAFVLVRRKLQGRPAARPALA